MCHILTTGKQCKTSNHSSARKLEPVQKDPALSMFNCCWWLLVSHAWQCVCHAASCLCSFLSAFTPGDEYCFSDQGRERAGGKKSPHRHKATCTQITQTAGTEHQKRTAKASFHQPLYPVLFMLKKKKKGGSICEQQYSNWQDSSLLFAWLYVWTHAWGCTEQFELQLGNEHYNFWWAGALKTSSLS